MVCGNRTNLFGLHQYDNQCEFFVDSKPIIPPGVGWLIVAGLGAVFSVATSILVWLDFRYGGTKNTSEHFNTAGRSIKAGLTACDIVSKWTWAATLLQSSNVAFKYGVSGPFWYASGATIQILLFAVLAIEVKRKAPTAHTVLEIVLVRWGKTAHGVFLVFCLLTNFIVTAMLILGGAAVIHALSGVNIYAAAFMIPVGVMLYIAHGGLKASILSAWAHVAVIYFSLCLFMFTVYFGSSDLGSISKVYERLAEHSRVYPIDGNYKGSAITMISRSGAIFGIINIVGNFGTVFVDQAYWQSAIAAKPTATYKGYILGGISWFAIPFAMATSLGLAARALDLPISISEAEQGKVPAAVAYHLLGRGGAFLLCLQLFMAVTASGAAEQMAVSSLFSYDVYRTYFNPAATGQQIILVGRIVICVFGIVSGILAVTLLKLGLDLGWVYLFMGVVIGSAVVPIAFSITWSKCSSLGAISGAIVGMFGGLSAWLMTTYASYGRITLETTGRDYPMLAGNLTSILLSAFICISLSLIWPQNFDWNMLQAIVMLEHDPNAVLAEDGDESPEALSRALTWTYKTGGFASLVIIVIWPCLSLPVGVFNQAYFHLWVVISIVWGLVGTVICIFVPLYESYGTISAVTLNILTCRPYEQKGPPTDPSNNHHNPSYIPQYLKDPVLYESPPHPPHARGTGAPVVMGRPYDPEVGDRSSRGIPSPNSGSPPVYHPAGFAYVPDLPDQRR